MTDEPSTTGGATPFATLRRRVLPWLQAAGIVLLLVAVYLVVRQQDLLSNAWSSLKAAPAWQIAAVVLLPLTNWFITSLLFYTLTRHSTKVRLGEMTALIGSAWLLNIIPGRPGLMGRVAYHTVVNHMPVKDSVKVIVVGIVANAVAVALALVLIGAAFLAGQMLPPQLAADATPKFLIMGAAVTLALLISVAWYQRGGGGRQNTKAPVAAWRFAFAVAMRYADYLVWVTRYWLAFKVIGLEITLTEAAGIAVVSQIVQLSPVQLGPREWAVGLAGAFLPSLKQTAATASTARTATGLTADLLNRAAELVVQLPVGLVCTWWVFRELKRAKQSPPSPSRS